MKRHIGFLVFPGFDLLDLSGPLGVFQWAERQNPDAYQLTVMSLDGCAVASESPVSVNVNPLVHEPLDTLLVVGGSMGQGALSPEMIAYVRKASTLARRTTSVCTGAFILAAAGVLDGVSATTHWMNATDLQALHPAVRVEPDRIFIKADNVWTSAGITAGIDMALALVEEDLGREASLAIARMLVVYHRRSGGQQQFSSLLGLDPDSDRIRLVLAYVRNHIADPLPVERLAEVAHLSARQFGRAFLAATGVTPAKAIERLRAEAARPRIEQGRESLDAIARSVGFNDVSRMRQSFIRIFGHPPQAIRRVSRSL
ncbi:GlxA family transcriptional regulator [Rhizobiaceae bacterium CRRU44]|uniref:GlxA family transcriptional regulator n=1 Tax=Ferranicluibacter rubi TaxID=2715133 RepID=A0AA43ZIM2_9HYPH|nr:GlxA family transcriptional regulator [Ferranicluibacter rubi]NHT77771.1 GlxA family transcriptional regulator [Ferranicluibacter rubi]